MDEVEEVCSFELRPREAKSEFPAQVDAEDPAIFASDEVQPHWLIEELLERVLG